MWRLSTSQQSALEVAVEFDRPPGIYLDHDSLMRVAKTPDLNVRFLEALVESGTLFFSWAGAFDVSGPQGDDAAIVQDFLTAIGEHWIPLELNVFRVIRREASEEPFEGSPCASPSFVNGYILDRLYELSPGGSQVVNISPELFDLGRVASWMQRDRDDARAQMERLKTETDALVRRLRSEVANDRPALDRLLPVLPLGGAYPSTALFNALLRPIAHRPQNESWARNDAIDLSHVVVAGSCAELIAVDKTWKRRLLATGIEEQKPGVRVWYSRELEDLLDEFERRVRQH